MEMRKKKELEDGSITYLLGQLRGGGGNTMREKIRKRPPGEKRGRKKKKGGGVFVCPRSAEKSQTRERKKSGNGEKENRRW